MQRFIPRPCGERSMYFSFTCFRRLAAPEIAHTRPFPGSLPGPDALRLASLRARCQASSYLLMVGYPGMFIIIMSVLNLENIWTSLGKR